MKKILIADDHKLFRQGLKILLEREKIAIVVGEASNGYECLDLVSSVSPDIILMDIDMPKMNGIDASFKILENYKNVDIIAISMHNDHEHYKSMIEAGVKGFILKSSGIDDIINSIKAVSVGETYFSNDILRTIIINLNKEKNEKVDQFDLSAREIEVLRHICNGLNNDEISAQMHISPTTVKGHRSRILSKTGMRNTTALVLFAIKKGFIKI